jgi:CheY-like chemotaxis protein
MKSTNTHLLYVEDNQASRQRDGDDCPRSDGLSSDDVARYASLWRAHGGICASKRHFDIILLDLNMKPLNGMEACQLLRQDTDMA